MFYYLYQITNNVNEKIYVGVHKTSDLNDGYMGSGRIIRSAIQKHNLSNFSKVILEFFDNAEAMYAKEKEVVNEEFLLRDDVYNLRRGGNGGFDYINKIATAEDKSLAGKLGGLRATENPHNWVKPSIKSCRKGGIKGGSVTMLNHGDAIRNAAKTEDVLNKRRNTFKERQHQQGLKNSNYGTCWISHIIIGSKKCKAVFLPEYIEQGWVKGRNIFKEQ